jgi:hypothetical protein
MTNAAYLGTMGVPAHTQRTGAGEVAMRNVRAWQVAIASVAAATTVAGLGVVSTRTPPHLAAPVAARAPEPVAEPPAHRMPPVLPAPPVAAPRPAAPPAATPPPVAAASDDTRRRAAHMPPHVHPPYFWLDPDGRPGWSTGFVWCAPPTTGRGRAPGDGVRLDLVLDAGEFVAGTRVTGTATVHNDSDERVRFDASAGGGFDGVLYDSTGRPVSAITGNDGIVPMWANLAPGETLSYPFSAATWTCGDTPDDDELLAPGAYSVAAALWWDLPDGGATHYWAGEPSPVRLLPEPDQSAPCRSDGTFCRDLPPTAGCYQGALAAGDYGTPRGLRLTVPDDPLVAQAGDDVVLAATVTNDSDEVAPLYVYDGIDGGVLLDKSGDVASGRYEHATRVASLSLAPGQSRHVSLRVRTRSCAVGGDGDQPVAPGRYDVRAALYVKGYGWWAAPDTVPVLVTP